MNEITIEFTVNGKEVSVTGAPNRTLLDVLRDDLGLTGAKDSCGGEGECGACTVIMDGEPVNSCLVLMGQADGHEVLTIEDLEKNGQLHKIQSAFIESGAVQCGYCTPGAVLAAKALLDRIPNPTDAEIRDGLSGNLCRCTGYEKMITAVHLAEKEVVNG